jgi:DNA-directed RNA polymerase subunit L
MNKINYLTNYLISQQQLLRIKYLLSHKSAEKIKYDIKYGYKHNIVKIVEPTIKDIEDNQELFYIIKG